MTSRKRENSPPTSRKRNTTLRIKTLGLNEPRNEPNYEEPFSPIENALRQFRFDQDFYDDHDSGYNSVLDEDFVDEEYLDDFDRRNMERRRRLRLQRDTAQAEFNALMNDYQLFIEDRINDRRAASGL